MELSLLTFSLDTPIIFRVRMKTLYTIIHSQFIAAQRAIYILIMVAAT